MASSAGKYKVFISHAGEDKSTIAIPLRNMLEKHGISAFVDETDMPPGTSAVNAMISAMESAVIAVVVLSPEFVARKWPMKELMCFLRRCQQTDENPHPVPVIIPFFYRLRVDELYNEPRLDRLDGAGKSIYRTSRFFERRDEGQPEAQIDQIKRALMKVREIMGVRNDLDATNENTFVMYRRRKLLLQELCDAIRRSVKNDINTSAASVKSSESARSDVCRIYLNTRLDTSDLVLDFRVSDGEENAGAREARSLKRVLSESKSGQNVIVTQGISGLDKTSVLRKFSSMDSVQELFTDEGFNISLGIHGTKRDLIEELIKGVERTGGRKLAKQMRRENDIGRVLESFQSWFEKKKCVFIVNDVHLQWHKTSAHKRKSEMVQSIQPSTSRGILRSTGQTKNTTKRVTFADDVFTPTGTSKASGVEERKIPSVVPMEGPSMRRQRKPDKPEEVDEQEFGRPRQQVEQAKQNSWETKGKPAGSALVCARMYIVRKCKMRDAECLDFVEARILYKIYAEIRRRVGEKVDEGLRKKIEREEAKTIVGKNVAKRRRRLEKFVSETLPQVKVENLTEEQLSRAAFTAVMKRFEGVQKEKKASSG